MHPLSPVDDSAEIVFLNCISKVREAALKLKLTGVKADVVQHDANFVTAGGNANYCDLPTHDMVGTVTAAEMIAVYDQRMVPADSPGRACYNKIMALATHDICPICGHGRVTTLDHYMPKSLFPGLAVSPRNLLPSCADCNKAKLNAAPTCASKQTINPYYDKYDSEPWLSAKIKKEIPVVPTFSVAPPTSWTSLMARRARYHFKTFNLGRVYASQATVELLDRKEEFTTLLNTRGHAEVKSHLQAEASSRAAARKNSWRAALYRALSASDWFCRVGCKG